MNDKIKRLFNSQYYGQKNLCVSKSVITVRSNTATFWNWCYDSSYLFLRTVSQLTDEEVILCGHIGFDFFNCIGCDYKLKVIRELTKISLAALSIDEKTCLVKIEISNVWKLNIAQIDYLRSIGILLPFCYLDEENKPETLSEAAILNLGWAMVKE